MTKSKELFEKAKGLIPGGVNSPVRSFAPYPFFTSRSDGSRLYDVDGKQYIDYCLGYGPLILGHSNPHVVKAIKAQLDNGWLYGTPTEQEVELAELISSLVPSAEMVRLVSTGGEATMSAIRVARGFTGRKKILKFEGGYHGAHDSVLVKAGSGATTFGSPDSLGIPEETARNTIVVPFNDVGKFETVMKKNKNDLAAVIVEPVLGNVGLILPEDGFLETLREETENFGVTLIFDEVITGFRLSLGGAQEYYGVIPDITTLGKVLGGGFPCAAYVGKEEIMKMISPSGKVYQGGTFSGNPVSVAAGLATLKLLVDGGTNLYSELEDKCDTVVSALSETMVENGLRFQVNHIASMFQLFFTENKVSDYATAQTADSLKFMRYHAKLLEQGVFVPPSQFETCFVSMAHTKQDIDETVEAMRLAVVDSMKTSS